ncbi:OmpA family protein [Portibacter lacus]|nr:OmpA family protein [Portibacter lacus]
MKTRVFVMLAFLMTSLMSIGQNYTVSGEVVDKDNFRPLDEALIEVYRDSILLSNFVETDFTGGFEILLPKDGIYTLQFVRSGYREGQIIVDTKNDNMDLRIRLMRLPGYEFQATIKDLIVKSGKKSLGKEIKNFKIEIYNNTTNKEVKVVEDDPKNSFMTTFERGNHYTMLIRKKGYFAKRIEAYVNIDGCILCFEGLGNAFIPEINEVTTDGNEKGSLITDIPLRKIVKDEAIRLDNIYYDFDKWEIRSDARQPLNDLVQILKRNPIIIELGSHTDSRGTDEYNMTLSDKRAQAAVDYIIGKGIKASRITAKGYGEAMPLNGCSNDVDCTEAEFQFNRRTEFKVTGFIESSSFDKKSLKQIIEEERVAKRRSVEVLEGL